MRVRLLIVPSPPAGIESVSFTKRTGLRRRPQIGLRSLPIPLPLTADGMDQGRAHGHQVLFAVGEAAVVFPPSYLVGG